MSVFSARGARGRAASVHLLVLLCALSAACGPGRASSGAGTASVSVANVLGGLGSIDVTSEASVRDSLFAVPPRAVWSVLPGVFRTLGIDTPIVDAPSGVMGNRSYEGPRVEERRLSLYLDCGSTFGGPRADTYRVTLFLLVQLSESVDGETHVRTVLDASARPREVSGNPVHCGSKGTLERRVMELIAEGVRD